ncbi:hypothetical protein chiPu_0004252 [Chiloscyllium punctatum]|uniref:Uncharacterized protein n=1 Tax=Chiloscyllium punctatum TaxID=137246 RepID=A0A401S628_CHIPU|nr:hypothetical protein [Chiloscyllium punctatum]
MVLKFLFCFLPSNIPQWNLTPIKRRPEPAIQAGNRFISQRLLVFLPKRASKAGFERENIGNAQTVSQH